MHAPLSWIKDFVELTESPEQIAAAFNQLGIEVEGFHVTGQGVSGIKVAVINGIKAHPNADRLRLVDIDDGVDPTTVVCGAPNLELGMKVPFARSGSTVADGFKMEKRKIRGEMSDGMLCSSKDLGLSEEHGGIIDLPADTQIGIDAGELLGVGEVVFELSITPNRPDAMCIVGLARELAAHFGRELRVPEPIVKSSGSGKPAVDVRATTECPRYVGWSARVTPGPSPEWMARRLTLAGMRPINAIVDVTNYVLLERNQPLHAFDAGHIDNGVIVRLANEGEKITTLDSKERTLSSADLVICDANDKPQAVAGIMGGEHSEVTGSTTEIVLESAYFTPHGIGVSSRRLGLRSEASHRFERGTDPLGALESARRAMQLLEEVAGAEVSSEWADVSHVDTEPLKVPVRTSRINGVLGTSITAEQARGLLAPIGMPSEGTGDDFVVTVPSFRPDITREIDIVEEVARQYGYDNIPMTMPSVSFHQGALTREQQGRRLIADVLVARGLSQAKCFPLVAPADVEHFGVAEGSRTYVANPLRSEESVLTPTLLPGLLKSVAHNLRQKAAGVELFEIDTVFGESNDLLMDESINLAVVFAGHSDHRPLGQRRAYDAFDATGALATLRDALGLDSLMVDRDAAPGFDKQRSAAIIVNGKVCGSVGEIDRKTLKHFGIDVPVAALEVSTSALINGKRRSGDAKPVSMHPPSFFDLAFEVDASVEVGALVKVVQKAAGDLGEDVRVFDVFEGKQVGEGRKSVAVAITLRSHEKTLTDADIKPVRDAAIKMAAKKLNAEVRGA